ncbi:MAG: hypothetical protein JNN01_11155 [Opitutaceae bacterium]|nr:hypothetical protein [Opitutaceae bacterium]
MFIVYVLAAAGFVTSMGFLVKALNSVKVPEGYEDATGFHYGRKVNE